MSRLLLVLLLPSGALADDGWAEIVNGKEEDGFPAAVSIGMDAGRFRFSACSASAITPRVLLTAAHCSAEFGVPVETIAEFGVAFVGSDIQDAEAIVEYDEIIVHPKYEGIGRTGTPQNDMSVIVLAEALEVEPVVFNTRELTNKDLDTTLVSVGYGITSAATQAGSGIKRSARVTIDDLDDQFIVSSSGTNNDRANVCSGDSGGPQYFKRDDGTWEQWSVHSWADQNCSFVSGSTRTDLFADWITKQVERVHGTADLYEAAGYYDNGACDDSPYFDDPECYVAEAAGGCSTTGGAVGPLALLGALALVGRRRR